MLLRYLRVDDAGGLHSLTSTSPSLSFIWKARPSLMDPTMSGVPPSSRSSMWLKHTRKDTTPNGGANGYTWPCPGEQQST